MRKQYVKVIGLTAIILLGVFLLIFDIFYTKMANEYYALVEKYQTLLAQYDEITATENAASEDKYSFIQAYRGCKYPVPSGIRRYTGEEPLRIYPSSEAPYVYDDYIPDVVEVINEVIAGYITGTDGKQEEWCLVIDERGVSGYVHRSKLVSLDENDVHASRGYEKETLGGFKIGDRIETLISALDRDYYLIYENGRIYRFPECGSVVVDDPIYVPFSGMRTLDAFVSGYNRVTRLRTDSPEFPLKDGYKAGDKAIEVLDFYSAKYERSYHLEEIYGNVKGTYSFKVSDEVILEFRIDTDELTENSVIESISVYVVMK